MIKLIAVEPREQYQLLLRFSDGASGVFDFSGFPDGEVDFSMIETVLECNPILKAQ